MPCGTNNAVRINPATTSLGNHPTR
jgi:hypothetical protein